MADAEKRTQSALQRTPGQRRTSKLRCVSVYKTGFSAAMFVTRDIGFTMERNLHDNSRRRALRWGIVGVISGIGESIHRQPRQACGNAPDSYVRTPSS